MIWEEACIIDFTNKPKIWLKSMIMPESISDDFVEKVEQKLGHGSGGWDMLNPKEIIAAVLETKEEEDGN